MAIVWNSETSASINSVDERTDEVCKIVVDPTVKRTLKLDELSLSHEDNVFNRSEMTAGISYPLICINDNIIMPEEINYFEISCESFLPTIYLVIHPNFDNLMSKDIPKDGDIISVFIRTTNDKIKPLRCDFIIRSVLLSNENEISTQYTGKITFSGSLYVPGINSQLQSFGICETSKSAIKDVAKRLGIGFAYNDVDDTNDKQIWLCPKISIEKYVSDIIDHSWKDEQSFYKAWIDIYYNLNFININKMLMSTDDVLDLSSVSSTADIQKLYPIDPGNENDIKVPKLLTNAIQEYRMSPFFVTNWIQSNNSSKITERIGSQINTHTFIHNQNIFNGNNSPYNVLTNVQMYDPAKTDKYIILRGRSSYDASVSSNMAHNVAQTDTINTHNEWSGIQYTLSDSDTTNDSNQWSGNVHINYNRAKSHNLLNIKELDKLYINVTVNGPCLQIMRGEKVPVMLVVTPGIAQIMNENENDTYGEINKLYSGTYIVDGYKIIFDYRQKESKYSNFKTVFTLKRREWPVPTN